MTVKNDCKGNCWGKILSFFECVSVNQFFSKTLGFELGGKRYLRSITIEAKGTYLYGFARNSFWKRMEGKSNPGGFLGPGFHWSIVC